MVNVIKAYLGSTPLFDTTGQTVSGGYIRPADWLELPAATADSIVGLYAVYDQQENYVTIRMITNDGSTYTIDWGDGNTTTASSNATIQYNYDFNNVALDGTLTSKGYKQAIITVTPQSGKTFTFCQLSNKPTPASGTFNALSSGWLDLNINLPNLITGRRLYISDGVYFHRVLERVNITSWGAITDATNLFFGCLSLQSINASEWNFANIQATLSMFQGSGLTVIDASNWDVGNVQAFNATFRDCPNLTELKCSTWNLSGCSSFANMFNGCASLKIIDTSQWNVSNVTNMGSMFFLCRSLEHVDVSNWNMSKVTSINGMFNTCTSLQEIDISNWNLPLCTNATNFVNVCQSLRKLGSCSFSAVTTIGALANGCNSLTNVGITGMAQSVSFTDCQMSSTALNTLYTNLATVGAAGSNAKTITVTNNYGTLGDDITIASNKGWAVSG
jgi:surface protein